MGTEPPPEQPIEERIPCPQCRELIAPAAQICRFCGCTLNPETGQAEAPPPLPPDSETPKEAGPAGGFAVASLVLGISSLAVVCCCWPLSAPLSILGIIFGVLGLKSSRRPLAVAGLVCSILGLLSIIGMFALMLIGQLPQFMNQGRGF